MIWKKPGRFLTYLSSGGGRGFLRRLAVGFSPWDEAAEKRAAIMNWEKPGGFCPSCLSAARSQGGIGAAGWAGSFGIERELLTGRGRRDCPGTADRAEVGGAIRGRLTGPGVMAAAFQLWLRYQKNLIAPLTAEYHIFRYC
jgi:hypothetical protein